MKKSWNKTIYILAATWPAPATIFWTDRRMKSLLLIKFGNQGIQSDSIG